MDKEKNTTCQQEMLHSCEAVNGHRVYRCQFTGLVCVISGVEPDEALLELACEGCVKKTPP